MSRYLSVVVAARNDNYGGNFLQRLQVFCNVLFEFWNKHTLDAELIIVEWNPPKNSSRLVEAVNWSSCPDKQAVRIITVSEELHRTLPNSERMPMFDCLAKNVGLRRALREVFAGYKSGLALQ